MNGHLDSGVLLRRKLGTLSPEASADADAHLSVCGSCAQRVRELDEDAQVFNRTVFPETLPGIQARLRKRQWAKGGAALAVAASLALLVWRTSSTQTQPSTHTRWAARGSPVLQVLVRRGTQSAPLSSVDALAAGDILQFTATGLDCRYLSIVARAPSGSVLQVLDSRELPEHQVTLPETFQIDASGPPEWLYAFFSRERVTSDSVFAALARSSDSPPAIDSHCPPVVLRLPGSKP